MAKIAVIGKGTIGSHLIERLPQYGHGVEIVMTRKGIYHDGCKEFDAFQESMSPSEMIREVIRYGKAAGVRHAMLAIPSGGELMADGRIEAGYLLELVTHSYKCITAGKSALANAFDSVTPIIKHVGYDAAWGGGAMFPTYSGYMINANPTHSFVVTMVTNGTLHYAQDLVQDGRTHESICSSALRAGFAEPPEGGKKLDALTMYRGEMDDIRRKIAIACNTRLRNRVGQTINQWDIEISDFMERDRRKVMSGNACYRYLVRLCSDPDDLEFFNDIDVEGGRINQRIGNVSIAAGFVNVMYGSALWKWIPAGVGNAIDIVQNGERVYAGGDGAGDVATVGSMMSNLHTFLVAEAA